MLHKGTDIAGLAYLSTFHAAISVLVNSPEFEPECVVSGEVNFDEVGEALLRDLEPIYAASDAIKEKAAKADAINLKPRVDDEDSSFKWREWCQGEAIAAGDHFYRVDKGDAVFTTGKKYEVALSYRENAFRIFGDDGFARVFGINRFKEVFRPAV